MKRLTFLVGLFGLSALAAQAHTSVRDTTIYVPDQTTSGARK